MKKIAKYILCCRPTSLLFIENRFNYVSCYSFSMCILKHLLHFQTLMCCFFLFFSSQLHFSSSVSFSLCFRFPPVSVHLFITSVLFPIHIRRCVQISKLQPNPIRFSEKLNAKMMLPTRPENCRTMNNKQQGA